MLTKKIKRSQTGALLVGDMKVQHHQPLASLLIHYHQNFLTTCFAKKSLKVLKMLFLASIALQKDN